MGGKNIFWDFILNLASNNANHVTHYRYQSIQLYWFAQNQTLEKVHMKEKTNEKGNLIHG